MTVFRTTAKITQSGMPDQAVNTWHADFATGIGAAARLTSALQTFYNAIKAKYSTTSTITIGEAVENYVGGLWVPVPASPVTVVGTGAGNLFAAQASLVVKWSTGMSGRTNRGRSYLGPFVDLQQDSGTAWSASFVSLVQTAATALIADLAGGSPAGNLTVFHKATGLSTPVTSAVARTKMGTQRRRIS